MSEIGEIDGGINRKKRVWIGFEINKRRGPRMTDDIEYCSRILNTQKNVETAHRNRIAFSDRAILY